MSQQWTDDEAGFEPIKKTYGNGDPRAANKGRIKRRLKDYRRLGGKTTKHKGNKK